MNKKKVILLFSDLEGTLTKESNEKDVEGTLTKESAGKFEPEDMHNFLSELYRLQELTRAKVHLHLVSPVYQNQMKDIMNQIDSAIAYFNQLHKWENPLSPIECGAAYPEDMISSEFTGDRIFPLREPTNSKNFDIARLGKADYVLFWCEHYLKNELSELVMSIYCGNGRNDLDAMDYIKNLNQGFIVCPKNSRHEVKSKTSLIGKKTDLPGITEGISEINRLIEKRLEPNKDETEQGNSLDEH